MRRPFPILLLAVLVGVLSWNCTQGSSGDGGGPATPTLMVSPPNPTVALGTALPFTVTDSNGDTVSLSLNQQGTGTALVACTTCGTLSSASISNGTTTGAGFTYTAPTVMPLAGTGVTMKRG